ncbi:MAG: glucose 1-dehydrogenase [Bacillota bacterium]|nr:glucose 1-dehydrogenase [Bacillota bacterium]MDI7249646.1 glucose 1-dehydrogenase [Bacillota bacterium]
MASGHATGEVREGLGLAGKVAIVTGAGSGIGRGIATLFARMGVRVACADLNGGAAGKVAREIAEGRGRALALTVDVTDTAQVGAMVEAAVAEFGAADILVNAAGVGTLSTLVDMLDEEWDMVLGVNLKGTFLCCRAFVSYLLREGRRGKIINVSSINEQIPVAGLTHYCASKGGVMMFTRAAALELAPYGIHVNALAPGAIDTPMMEEPLMVPELRAALLRQIPFGRVGRPLDVARAAAFLASPWSDWVTGHTLYVDGGMHLVGEESYLYAFERAMGHHASIPRVPCCWPPEPGTRWPTEDQHLPGGQQGGEAR